VVSENWLFKLDEGEGLEFIGQ